MQTALSEDIRDTDWGREADRILRSCVHCGFCTATCPTYQLLGDELDGPRGRIYQIKQVLEGDAAGAVHTRRHLDRCLTCRACETTCPSGVEYARLLDIGRREAERHAPRPLRERWLRRALLAVLPRPRRFGPLLRLGRLARPLLPARLRAKIPAARAAGNWPAARHARRMLVLDGCVQPSAAPQIDAAAARVLDRLGISLIAAPGAGCCGAVAHHLNAGDAALQTARRNVDAWLPLLEQGAEALVVTASGCAVHLKEYGHLLAGDPAYAARAARVAGSVRDLAEILEHEDLDGLGRATATDPIAFHSPCTLQHGERLAGRVEALLTRLGFRLAPVPDAHLCCGSAGTYSLLQPTLSGQLRERKLAALHSGRPALIATANIGCLLHLGEGAEVPVRHWIELVDQLSPP